MTADPDMDNAQKQNDQKLPGHGATATAQDTAGSVGNPAIDNQPVDDILVAVTSVFSDTVPNIEHTLDQLTVATDLFDVPALDLDTATSF
jgi:hypothetical protein